MYIAQIMMKKIPFYPLKKKKHHPKIPHKTPVYFKQCFSLDIPNGKYFILLLQKIKAVNIEVLSILQHTTETPRWLGRFL